MASVQNMLAQRFVTRLPEFGWKSAFHGLVRRPLFAPAFKAFSRVRRCSLILNRWRSRRASSAGLNPGSFCRKSCRWAQTSSVSLCGRLGPRWRGNNRPPVPEGVRRKDYARTDKAGQPSSIAIVGKLRGFAHRQPPDHKNHEADKRRDNCPRSPPDQNQITGRPALT